MKKMTKSKIKRRMQLLDDMLDYCLRSTCMYAFCDGPKAPIRVYKTCTRCACIHRAIKMGLVKEVKKTYVKTNPHFGDIVVSKGKLEHFSAVDGRQI